MNVKNFNNMTDEEKYIFFADNGLELIHYGDGLEIFEIKVAKITETNECIFEVYSPIDIISFPISELKYVQNSMFEIRFGEEDGDGDYYYYELFAIKLANPFDEEGNIKKDLK